MSPVNFFWQAVELKPDGSLDYFLERRGEEMSCLSFCSLEAFLEQMKGLDTPLYALLPGTWFIQKNIKIPSQDENEIQTMCKAQISSLTPFDQNEVTFFFRILKKTEDGYSNIALHVLPDSVFLKHLTPLIQNKFFPDRLGMDVLWIPFFLENKKTDLSLTRFIHAENKVLRLGIIENHELVYSRTISLSVTDPSASESVTKEISATWEFASRKHGFLLPPVIALISSLPREQLLVFQNSTETYEFFPLTPQEKIEGIQQSLKTSSFSLPVLDTLRTQAQRKIKFGRLSLVLAGILFCLMATLFTDLYWMEQKKTLLETQVQSIKKEASVAKYLTDRMGLFKRHFESSELMSAAILELYKITPKDVSLTQLQFRDYRKMLLKGIAEKSVIDFSSVLQKSPYFKEVNLRYQNRLPGNKGIEFQIQCEVGTL